MDPEARNGSGKSQGTKTTPTESLAGYDSNIFTHIKNAYNALNCTDGLTPSGFPNQVFPHPGVQPLATILPLQTQGNTLSSPITTPFSMMVLTGQNSGFDHHVLESPHHEPRVLGTSHSVPTRTDTPTPNISFQTLQGTSLDFPAMVNLMNSQVDAIRAQLDAEIMSKAQLAATMKRLEKKQQTWKETILKQNAEIMQLNDIIRQKDEDHVKYIEARHQIDIQKMQQAEKEFNSFSVFGKQLEERLAYHRRVAGWKPIEVLRGKTATFAFLKEQKPEREESQQGTEKRNAGDNDADSQPQQKKQRFE